MNSLLRTQRSFYGLSKQHQSVRCKYFIEKKKQTQYFIFEIETNTEPKWCPHYLLPNFHLLFIIW